MAELDMPPPPAPPVTPFALRRRFAITAALVIGLAAIVQALVLGQFLTEQLFKREAEVSRDFIQSHLISGETLAFIANPADAQLRAHFRDITVELARMPGVVRANLYSPEHRMLWSSNRELVGKTFPDNDELDDALKGELVLSSGDIEKERGQFSKAEHMGLASKIRYFVEIYVPLHDETGRIVAVFELYKAPLALTEAIHAARWTTAVVAATSALVLYLFLYGLVRRAAQHIQAQQARLLENETLAATGQLASAVAHNIRNPLASISSSAELLTADRPCEVAEHARNILHDAGRISERINELLRLAAPVNARQEDVDLHALLSDLARDQQAAFERRHQRLTPELGERSALARADGALLRHALASLLSNAAEAMREGGVCVLRLSRGESAWRIDVQDTGSGIASRDLEAVQQAFVTSKPQGMGLGLMLARRIVERLGGQLSIQSELGRGTTVSLTVPSV